MLQGGKKIKEDEKSRRDADENGREIACINNGEKGGRRKDRNGLK